MLGIENTIGKLLSEIVNLRAAIEGNTLAVNKLNQVVQATGSEKTVTGEVIPLDIPNPEDEASKREAEENQAKANFKSTQDKLKRLVMLYNSDIYEKTGDKAKASKQSMELAVANIKEVTGCSRLDTVPDKDLKKLDVFIDEKIKEITDARSKNRKNGR